MSSADELFNPTEEHRMLRQTVAEFARREVEPQAAEYDEKGELNVPLFRRLGELGLLGITVPIDDGGAGLDAAAAVIVHHELSKVDPGFCLAYLAHAMLFVNNFYHCSNAEQRERYLDKVIEGEWIGGMGMTEPGAGTDVMAMSTVAVRDGEHWVLNGTKTYITNGCEGYCFLVYAKVEGRITAFLVDRDCPGFSTSNHIDKLGMRGSTMSELIFEDCRIPATNLLGEPGGGLTHMMRNLEIERLTLAAMSVGIADRCVEIMVDYADQRKAFGESLNRFGQIQRYLSEGYAMAEAAKCLVYNVARDVTPDTRARVGCDAAKLFAAPVGKQVADYAMQVMGGAGYCKEYPVERLWRDAKLLEIGGGTIEAHQKNITKDLTKAWKARQG
ncbi:acyl-CoA dehydrogenase family protein [Pseudenhygromyxa sp. WMMC2535]|uniref:acyl-CoA dehydrogenase family protein n=1 Tax=Pseudenhygromyxa sp. WMMC2535 TaxID=2712867 RepID=UPI001556ED30|nr:acyl-CoA dehydrogenase family protein [Pseudenhygromyxa sp. WMMC2535]NVB37143.1 acyl-CoA dehydrogenase family protein [Pseudenhygromyxa sp. WMMC2535]